MARYLSQAWFDEVNEVARSSQELREATAGTRLTVQQVVTDGPDGEVRYWLSVDDGSVEVHVGELGAAEGEADATVSQTYETAAAVSRGELRTEEAFLAGHIRLRGNIPLLLTHQATLNSLGQAFAQVRRHTEYA